MSFKGVVFTDKIGDSPAAVNLRSGVLHINPKVFDPYGALICLIRKFQKGLSTAA
jgi:hypothetical protein